MDATIYNKNCFDPFYLLTVAFYIFINHTQKILIKLRYYHRWRYECFLTTDCHLQGLENDRRASPYALESDLLKVHPWMTQDFLLCKFRGPSGLILKNSNVVKPQWLPLLSINWLFAGAIPRGHSEAITLLRRLCYVESLLSITLTCMQKGGYPAMTSPESHSHYWNSAMFGIYENKTLPVIMPLLEPSRFIWHTLLCTQLHQICL